MNNAKLKSIINKKANGDNNISMQLYQMFFFEHILERLSKSKYKDNIILKGRIATIIYYRRRLKNNERHGCEFKKSAFTEREYIKNFSRNIEYRYW